MLVFVVLLFVVVCCCVLSDVVLWLFVVVGRKGSFDDCCFLHLCSAWLNLERRVLCDWFALGCLSCAVCCLLIVVSYALPGSLLVVGSCGCSLCVVRCASSVDWCCLL